MGYEESFAPVAKIMIVCTLIVVSTIYQCKIYQFHVKNEFLNGYTGLIPVGHNVVNYDIKMIKKELYNADTKAISETKSVDTLNIAREIRKQGMLSDIKGNSLGALCTGLGIKDGLRKLQPLWFIGWRVREAIFSGCHGSHAPEALIVITQRCRNVAGHIILIFSDLELHRLHNFVIVSGITRPVPIIDQSPPHSTSFPPVVVTSRWRTG